MGETDCAMFSGSARLRLTPRTANILLLSQLVLERLLRCAEGLTAASSL